MSEPEAASVRASKPSVLIVDDQLGIRGVLARHLAARGFAVRTARDGEEAFRKIVREPPDVLLLELYLPRLNGHDLLLRMREAGIAVGLVLTMSGHADTTDARECLRLGASDHLRKPLDAADVYRKIRLRLDPGPG